MMDFETISQRVIELVADTFNMDKEDVTLDTERSSIYPWDSLQHTILILRLQQRLGVTISNHAAVNVATVGDIADVFAEALA